MDNKFTKLLIAAGGYIVYCIFSAISKENFSMLWTVVLIGIAVPLYWGWRTKTWKEMGFTRENLKQGLIWAMIGGVAGGVLGIVLLDNLFVPENLPQQLLIGLPVWLLIASPFQEFFFRGWLQPILEKFTGAWGGLLISNLLFTIWHYVSPIAEMAPFPLYTFVGFASIYAAGLVYGYVFMRTRNIAAPWIAHVIQGILLIVVGAADFVGAMTVMVLIGASV